MRILKKIIVMLACLISMEGMLYANQSQKLFEDVSNCKKAKTNLVVKISKEFVKSPREFTTNDINQGLMTKFGGITNYTTIVNSGFDAKTSLDIGVRDTNFYLISSSIAYVPIQDSSNALSFILSNSKKDIGFVWDNFLYLVKNSKNTYSPSSSEWDMLSNASLTNSKNYSFGKSVLASKIIEERDMKLQMKDMNIATLSSWILDGEPKKSLNDVKAIKETIKTLCVTLVKINLRKQGKTFVIGEDGINPIQQKMQPIVDALNAPECNGLEAALSGIVTLNIDRTRLETDVKKYMNDVFYGIVPPSPSTDGSIAVLLGPDGYNNWIKSYNLGTSATNSVSQ